MACIGLRAGRASDPLDLTAKRIPGNDFHRETLDSRLVRITAHLVDVLDTPQEKVLWLQDERVDFKAILDTQDPKRVEPQPSALRSLRPASRLELTGICVQRLDIERVVRTFELWLRSPADVPVIKAASWWMARHTRSVLVTVSLVLLAALAWLQALRARVRDQTAESRASETRYRGLVDYSPEAIFVHDESGRVTFANPATAKLLGLAAPEAVVGLTPMEMVAPSSLNRAATDRTRPEGRRRSPVPGTPRDPVGWHGREVESVGLAFTREGRRAIQVMMYDVTERKQAEQALRESEERFRPIAETIDAVFWMASQDMQRFDYVSPAYERIWGRPVADLYADTKQWSEALPAEDRERVFAELAKLGSSHDSISVEFRVVRPDRAVHWVQGRAFALRSPSGQPTRFLGIVSDITEQRRAQDELAATRKRLFETSRQAGMAEVATSVLHNVGNVLNAVNLSTTLLLEKTQQSRIPNLAKAGPCLRRTERTARLS